VRGTGGRSYADFYATPLGQIAQVFILVSGILSWWLTNKIAHRGIYLDDNPAAPSLEGHVEQPGQKIKKEVVKI
ncbi:MAG: hypothetical protein HC853_14305, partial [Anaerolineae bacterium]|nr:hypothetical protein [Anaerolineae bacterium]